MDTLVAPETARSVGVYSRRDARVTFSYAIARRRSGNLLRSPASWKEKRQATVHSAIFRSRLTDLTGTYMEYVNTHVDAVIQDYLDRYCASNSAAKTLRSSLNEIGIGLRPVIDHISIRTLDVSERSREFEALGFVYDDVLGVMERDSWWAKVYRKPGYPPVYIDQPFTDRRGSSSPMRSWVEQFGDGGLHHIALAVDVIDKAITRMTSMGIAFTGEVSGLVGGPFRQIYTEPEVVDGAQFTVLELVERRWGFTGFWSPMSPSVGV